MLNWIAALFLLHRFYCRPPYILYRERSLQCKPFTVMVVCSLVLHAWMRELLDTVKARKLAYYGHTMMKTRELSGERDNARNNARCTQARKTTHGLDGQHQYVDRTPRGRVDQNHRRQINGECTSMVWPTVGSKTAKEQNRMFLFCYTITWTLCYAIVGHVAELWLCRLCIVSLDVTCHIYVTE